MSMLPTGMMKAQVLTGPGKLEYIETEIPLITQDQVLVRLISACICNGSDQPIFEGVTSHSIPMVFGHEPYGEIVACGDHVKSLKNGDRISWWFTTGAFAEYVAIDPSAVAVAKVPEILTEEEAPIIELVAASARAVKREDINEKSRVLILGLGPSGLIMAQRAKILGASKVVGWDLYPMRREKGLELGCDAAFDPRDKEVIAETLNKVGEVDLVIDAMGNDILPGEPTFDRAIQVLKMGGKIISYGHPSKGRKLNPFYFQVKNAIMVPPENNIDKVQILLNESLQHIIEGKLCLKPLVSQTIPLQHVREGLSMTSNHPDKYLKVIVKI